TIRRSKSTDFGPSTGGFVSHCIILFMETVPLHTIATNGAAGPLRNKGLWLAVDEVIHHDDVMLAIIIRPGGNLATRDLHPGDARVGKHDAEEGQAVGVRRGRDEAAKEQIAVGIEVFDQRAGACLAWGAYVCEDRAEAPHRCWGTTVGTGYKEQTFGDVAAHRSEQPRGAEGAEDGAVGRVAEEHSQPRWSSLRKPHP